MLADPSTRTIDNYVAVEFEGHALVPPFDPGNGGQRMPIRAIKEMIVNQILCKPIYLDDVQYILVSVDDLKLKREGRVVWGEWRIVKKFWGGALVWNPTREELPCTVVGFSQTHGTLRAHCASPRAEESPNSCYPRVEVTYPVTKFFPHGANLNITMTAAYDTKTKRSITIGTRLICVPEEVVAQRGPDGNYYFKAKRARCWLQQ